MTKNETARVSRVLLVDDHQVVRSGVRGLLEGETGFDVVGEAADGDDGLRLARELRPDLIVLDHEMPGRRGLEILSALRTELPKTLVVMFTLDSSIEADALALGASAHLSKDASAHELIGTLRRVVSHSSSPTATAAPSESSRPLPLMSMQRWPRAPFVVFGLLLSYVGAFAIAEPAIGAGAAALSVVPVALAGVLLGPELGLLTAALVVFANAALWTMSGYALGEPILRIGSNGLGIITLLALGAGFGAMREIGGRLSRRGRRVFAMAEAARSMADVDGAEQLSILVDAALRLVQAKTALLYTPTDDGGLEVVAAAGVLRTFIGARATTESALIRQVLRDGSTHVTADFARESDGIPFAGYRSAAVVPARDAVGLVRGALVVLHPRPNAYHLDELAALRRLALFVSLELRSQRSPSSVAQVGG
jgi:CheY-like chemotaxis protein